MKLSDEIVLDGMYSYLIILLKMAFVTGTSCWTCETCLAHCFWDEELLEDRKGDRNHFEKPNMNYTGHESSRNFTKLGRYGIHFENSD